jgi:non-heme chloroperoxidase
VARLALVGSVVPGLVKSKDNPDGIDASVFEGIKGGLRGDRATFLAGLLKDAFYDVSIQGTSPVTQQVLDWSLQMSMQAGLRALISSVDAFGKDDFRKELSGITVPTLIVHGSGDKPVPFELTARQAAKGISQATLIDYKGASHGILVTERDRVTADLLKFLKA